MKGTATRRITACFHSYSDLYFYYSGIWLRDLRERTKLSLAVLNAALKSLEGTSRIKEVRSIESKTKKLYMLFEISPSSSVIGGPWYIQHLCLCSFDLIGSLLTSPLISIRYTEQEFDHSYVADVANTIGEFKRLNKFAFGVFYCDLFLSYSGIRF